MDEAPGKGGSETVKAVVKLSILIVNWNSKDYLRDCLWSIRRTCSGLSLQVVVVDGGSFDGCSEMLVSEFPEVKFVQSPENIGFGRSNNLGFDSVTGEALLLLNPDTELRPGAVAELLKNLEQMPDVGIVGARLLNSDGSLQYSSVHPLPSPWNAAFDTDWGRRRWWSRKGPPADSDAREVEAVSGACMMLRSETFRRLGGFDSRYFMYAEDMDLCFRIRSSNLRILHAPRAVVLHHGGGSSRTCFSKFSTVMIREALSAYMLVNHGRLHAVVYRAFMTLSAVIRIPALLVSWAVASEMRRTARRASFMRWWTALRWCIGLENWAKRHFDCLNLASEWPLREPDEVQANSATEQMIEKNSKIVLKFRRSFLNSGAPKDLVDKDLQVQSTVGSTNLQKKIK